MARYATLLAEEFPGKLLQLPSPKAALEMRSKVRDALIELQIQAKGDGELQKWSDLAAKMDSARIGTPRLCAEILRAFPAEAGIDPRFEVLDGSMGKAYHLAVEDTLKSLVAMERFASIEKHQFIYIKDILQTLLEKRFDSVEVFRLTSTIGIGWYRNSRNDE